MSFKIEKNPKNNEPLIKWTYKITGSTHHLQKSNKTMLETRLHQTTLNQDLKKLLNIRNVLFIYYHEPTQKYYITTTEPPEGVEFKNVKPQTIKKQTNINIPKKFFKDLDNKQATFIYHSHTSDYINQNQRLTEIIIEERQIQ